MGFQQRSLGWNADSIIRRYQRRQHRDFCFSTTLDVRSTKKERKRIFDTHARIHIEAPLSIIAKCTNKTMPEDMTWWWHHSFSPVISKRNYAATDFFFSDCYLTAERQATDYLLSSLMLSKDRKGIGAIIMPEIRTLETRREVQSARCKCDTTPCTMIYIEEVFIVSPSVSIRNVTLSLLIYPGCQGYRKKEYWAGKQTQDDRTHPVMQEFVSIQAFRGQAAVTYI